MKTQTEPTTGYLASAWSLEELNRLYRVLAHQFHPDRGGDLRKMQDLNLEAEYRRANLEHQQNQAHHHYTPHTDPLEGLDPFRKRAYNWARVSCFGCSVAIEKGEVVVRGGGTFHHKEQLKLHGFWWNPSEKFWHFARISTYKTGGA